MAFVLVNWTGLKEPVRHLRLSSEPDAASGKVGDSLQFGPLSSHTFRNGTAESLWGDGIGEDQRYGQMMLRNVSTPSTASRALHYLVPTATYKPLRTPIPPPPSQLAPIQPLKIQDHEAIPTLKGAFSNAFSCRFRKIHAYSVTSINWREMADVQGETKFSKRWNERTDSLWWTVTSYKSFADKRVVRTYASRKLRLAFIESLRKKGIAPDGSRLPECDQKLAPVFGTASLHPKIDILTTRMTDLVRDTDNVVRQILWFQDKDVATSERYVRAKDIGKAKGNKQLDDRKPRAKKVPRALPQKEASGILTGISQRTTTDLGVRGENARYCGAKDFAHNRVSGSHLRTKTHTGSRDGIAGSETKPGSKIT